MIPYFTLFICRKDKSKMGECYKCGDTTFSLVSIDKNDSSDSIQLCVHCINGLYFGNLPRNERSHDECGYYSDDSRCSTR